MNGTRLVLLGLLFAAASSAQDSITHLWPTVSPFGEDQFRRVTVGRLIHNHPGRVLAIVRDDKVFLALDPANLASFEEVTPPGIDVFALACLPTAAGGGTDRLAALTGGGLAILSATGQAPDLLACAPLPAFAGCRVLASRHWQVGAVRHHLLAGSGDATQPGTVRLAIVGDAAASTPVGLGTFVAGAHVLDLAFVDWVVGGAPELAVLTAAGLAIVDAGLAVVAAVPQATLGGKLGVVPREPAGEDLLGVVQLGTWHLFRHAPAGLAWCGELPLPASASVRGVAVGHLDSDACPDLMVSTDGLARVVVLASGGGFPTDAAILLHDADPESGAVASNGCPGLLDDVDDNGEVDAVALSRITIGSATDDRVIVWPNAADAVRGELGLAPLLPEAPSFTIAEGPTPGTYHAAIAEAWASEPEPERAVGMRLVVPPSTSGGAADRMSIVVWGLDPDLLVPIDMEPVRHYWWTLPSGVGPRDVYVPIPNAHSRVLLEVRRVQMDPAGTAVLAAEAATYFTVAIAGASDTWVGLVDPLLGPIPEPVPADWLAVEAGGGPNEPIPAVASTGPGGDRFVGASLPAPPKPPTKPKKSVPPPAAGPSPPL
jgi:hypothetical protein